MKEMVYKPKREVEVLHSGKYNGYDFVILSLGTHPTAYVRLPKTHIGYKKGYDDVAVTCNGGLTYANDNVKGSDKTGWWIGWDYAHCGDYSGYDYDFSRNGHKWSTEEIFDEVKSVISQLKSNPLKEEQ